MTEEGDDVSDESEESEIEEELGFFSLIDAINPYTTFKHALASAWFYFCAVVDVLNSSVQLSKPRMLHCIRLRRLL